jgi:predicted lipoprotein
MKSRRTVITFASIILMTSLFIVGCKKDRENENAIEFDKASLLSNLADNVILPALNDFSSKINDLESSYSSFSINRTAPNLEDVRTKWKAAYLSWQAVKVFDFGPIRDYGFKSATGTYPTDSVKINDNVTNGGYNLASSANVDAIGLPSLDYLLYRVGALNYFVGNDPYATYAYGVIQKLKSETTTIVAAWNSYRNTFVSSTGTESTSAFSLLVNEFCRDYELTKNSKLGIPLGKQSLGIQLPAYIEARLSGLSLEIQKASVVSLTNVYQGASGVGFDDYLISLERSSLAASISTRFSEIRSKIDSFNGTLEQEMSTNTVELDNLYMLYQGQVISIKTDMSSAFGVLITYQDNDGD